MKTFIISVIIATLSGMGVGGGGLLVIYLTLFEGVEQIIAQGANLCFFIIAAIASTVYNLKKKKIVLKITFILSLFGVLGALGGAHIAGIIDPSILRKTFGTMLVLGGISSFFSSFGKKKQI